MSGLRLDGRAAYRLLRLALFSGMTALYYVTLPLVATPLIASWYAVTVWIAYYGGLSLILGGPGRKYLIRRFGEDRGYALFEVALGVLFLNQGFAQAVVINAFGDGFPALIPAWMSYLGGAVLMVVGLSCKVWAANTTGLDTYYCRDMFIGRSMDDGGGLIISGPYRYVGNPMYSVGNLQGYGWAVWSRSVEGIAFAMIFQVGIYLFYHLFERPFVRRAYARR
ncbi:PEMT/PEM2 family methyltransferase [Nonomuraea sp. NPDC049480]|uniref:PEMT/PEM2 family methyltransferase n=1 Tax=Nonomuraea sp. NPDC049480 TaxID=3364353 RepID=UPI0037B1A632